MTITNAAVSCPVVLPDNLSRRGTDNSRSLRPEGPFSPRPSDAADRRTASTEVAFEDFRRHEPSQIRFREGNHTGFYSTLKARVRQYFEASKKSRFADHTVAIKAAVYGILVVGSYGLILSNAVSPLGLLVLAILFGLSSILLAINVAHDAAHGALLPSRRLNRLIQTAIFTLLGANAYLWRLRHIKSHHVFPNVNGCDVDIDNNWFLRLSPNQPRKPMHRYQHIYAPFIFWLVDIHAVFYQDFVYLFKKRLANLKNIKHPASEYVWFAVCKFAYIAIVGIIPIAVLPLPWWQVVIGALVMSFVSSVVFVTLLIGTHFSDETIFPEIDESGFVPNDWAVHALVTSLDWNPTSSWANFLAGGANSHAAHHLFPTVSHCHYIAITKLIQRTAAEFAVPYNQTTLPGVVASHFRFLKRMGQA